MKKQIEEFWGRISTTQSNSQKRKFPHIKIFLNAICVIQSLLGILKYDITIRYLDLGCPISHVDLIPGPSPKEKGAAVALLPRLTG